MRRRSETTGKGRLFLVSGASRGIGEAVARRLLNDGERVILAGRDPAKLERVIAASEPGRGNAFPLELDLTSATSIAQAAEWVERKFGLLDGIINNAGIFVAHDALAFSRPALDAMFDTNLYGPWRLILACLPSLTPAEDPCIVNVSSTTASIGLTASHTPIAGVAERRVGYCCSKAALNMLTAQLAQAFARRPELSHIRIHAVSPGYVATAMNDFTGSITPEKAAETVIRPLRQQEEPGKARFLYRDGELPW